MIQRNLNPAGRMGCIVFGLAQLLDGVVRVVSVGFFIPLSLYQCHVNKPDAIFKSSSAPDNRTVSNEPLPHFQA